MKRSILIFSLFLSALNLHGSSPASLNTAFNGTGILNLLPTSPSEPEMIQSIAIQPDGKIVFAGYITTTSVVASPATTFYGILGRLNPDGSLDSTFNAAGTTPGYTLITLNNTSSQSMIFTVKIQSTDNKIVVTGSTQQSGIDYGLLARYLPNGKLDTVANGGSGFGTSSQGFIYVYPATYGGAIFFGLALQSNGSILTCGSAYISQQNDLPLIARFTSNGTLDSTFNSSSTTPGYSILPQSAINPNMFGSYFAIALQDNGSIVTTGYIGTNNYNIIQYNFTSPGGKMIVARYNNGTTNSGQLDTTTFNAHGTTPGYIVPTYLGAISAGYGITLQSDQKIIIAGWANPSTTNPIYTVMRLNTDGSLDTSFNSSGQNPGINQSVLSENVSFATAVVMQPDQTILTAGISAVTNAGPFNLAAIRYDQNGVIDSTFDFSTNQNSASLQFRAIDMALDKTIIAAGLSVSSTNYSLLFYDFLGGSTPQPITTLAANNYGYNSAFLTEFLYVNFYAETIADTTARNAAITSANTIINSYISAYSNQHDFNFLSYIYLINSDLLAAGVALSATYQSSSTQITQFFAYIIARGEQLSA